MWSPPRSDIPLQIAFQPLQAQEKAISARLDITKFKDPKFVESFVQRYLLAAASNGSDSTTASLSSPRCLGARLSF